MRKDPTIPVPESRKKIMFYDSADRQTKLRIRCDFDGISQSQFFRMMITGYINNDDLILSYLERWKEEHEIQGQQKRSKIAQFQAAAKKTTATFALAGADLENIFDIIEQETDL